MVAKSINLTVGFRKGPLVCWLAIYHDRKHDLKFACARAQRAARYSASEPPPTPLCYGSAHTKGKAAMNRNVTISLGALIVIIIIVALIF